MTSGSYLIFTEIIDQGIYIEIGKLGNVFFEPGKYCYIGSAMGKGSTSLEHRVIRHIKTALKSENQPILHWHIDFFLSNPYTKLCNVFLIPSKSKEECNLAKIVKSLSDNSVKRFGSSDCSCDSHLFYFSDNNEWINSLELDFL